MSERSLSANNCLARVFLHFPVAIVHLFFELNGARKVCEIVRNVYIVDCPFINQVLLRHLMIIVQILIHLGLDGSRLLLYQFDQPKRFALILN